MSTTSRVVVIIGPSACGKSSVTRVLHRQRVVRIHPTWTTRPRRPDERRGSPEHRFVTEAVFDELDALGFFLDTVAMFGLPYRYGLPLPAPAASGPVDVVMLRAPLVGRFQAHVPGARVYQIEDRPDRARARLIERRTPADDIAARLHDNAEEIVAGRRLADRVFLNDSTIERLAARVAAALHEDIPDHTVAALEGSAR